MMKCVPTTFRGVTHDHGLGCLPRGSSLWAQMQEWEAELQGRLAGYGGPFLESPLSQWTTTTTGLAPAPPFSSWTSLPFHKQGPSVQCPA